MLEKNGLKLHSIGSIANPLREADFSFLIQNYWGKVDGYFVAYLHYKVLIGKYNNGIFEDENFEQKYIIKLRLFNELQELYIWRNGAGNLSGRLRIDCEGDAVDVVDAWQALYGTKCEEKDGYTFLSEDRGTNMLVPFSGIKEEDLPVRIHTRNYIGYNELGQSGYEDCRFLVIHKKRYSKIGG